jgi:hypothetical protein
MLATIGFIINDEPKALIHWVLVHPRRSRKPPTDIIEEDEEETREQKKLISSLNEEELKRMKLPAARDLQQLGIRSAEKTRPVIMRKELLTVMRTKTRVGQLRRRAMGRPDEGGAIEAPIITARSVSEYFFRGLVPFLKGDGLKAGDLEGCKFKSSDLGLAYCPDGGKLEFQPELPKLKMLLDNAKAHLPPTVNNASAFERYSQNVLGLAGCIFLPPYTPSLQPCELFFAFVKHYVRKYAPKTTQKLVQRLREATAKVTGAMIMNWYRKCGFVVAGQPEKERKVDPNKGVKDRCSLLKRLSSKAENTLCATQQTARSGKKRRLAIGLGRGSMTQETSSKICQ